MQKLKNKTNEQAKPNSWIWRTDCLLLKGEGLRGRQDGWRNLRGTHLHYKSNNSLGCNMQPGNYSGSDSSESHSFVSDSLQPHGLYSPRNSPGQNTGMGSLSLLQGIFPTQGSNPCLPHCRWILCQLSHKGSPRILEWVAYPFSTGSSQPRNQTRVSCIAGGFFRNWAIREANSSTMSYHSQ